jgi:hypothetical protein
MPETVPQPSNEHGNDEQVALIDQPGLESVRCEFRTSHDEITGG